MVLFFVLLSGYSTKAQGVSCPDGYQLKTVEFVMELPYDPNETCIHPYTGPCRYKAYYCVRCDVTAPRLTIFLKRIEMLDYNGDFTDPYRCHCGRGIYTLPRPNFIYDAIVAEAFSKLLYHLLENYYCSLNVCDANPPSYTIDMSYKVFDCYYYKYEPVNCIGPVSINYDCEGSGYCEFNYRVCVYINPNTGRAELRKELIYVTHFGTAGCLPRDQVFPPGTMFPRFGECLPDETECMYDDTNCE